MSTSRSSKALVLPKNTLLVEAKDNEPNNDKLLAKVNTIRKMLSEFKISNNSITNHLKF